MSSEHIVRMMCYGCQQESQWVASEWQLQCEECGRRIARPASEIEYGWYLATAFGRRNVPMDVAIHYWYDPISKEQRYDVYQLIERGYGAKPPQIGAIEDRASRRWVHLRCTLGPTAATRGILDYDGNLIEGSKTRVVIKPHKVNNDVQE